MAGTAEAPACGRLLLMPIISNPQGRFDEAKAPVTPPGQGVGWVALAVEDDDARVGRNKRRFPVIGGPSGDAVVLEAGAPVLRPVGKFARAGFS